MGFWRELHTAGVVPDWTSPFSWAAVSDAIGQAWVLVVSEGRLLVRVSDTSGGWPQRWAELRPLVAGTTSPEPVLIGPESLVTAVPEVGAFDGTDLYLAGDDGAIYHRRGWKPGDLELWRRLETAGFDLAPQSLLRVIGRQIVALSQLGEL
jgi:hypothetical protein